jgi:hypothetical protein
MLPRALNVSVAHGDRGERLPPHLDRSPSTCARAINLPGLRLLRMCATLQTFDGSQAAIVIFDQSVEQFLIGFALLPLFVP